MKENILYFLTGSQELYGEDVLKQVDVDSREIVEYLNACEDNPVTIVYKGTVKNSKQILDACLEINGDDNAIGVITWMHTFSPAKMWIKGLSALSRPMLHLHTQANERLPYGEIDMDFMNLNQSAHGDREFGFIGSRMRINRTVVAGYYRDKSVTREIFSFARIASGVKFSRNLKVCRFGDNMRDVAVTEGDKVEAQIKFGWEVDYYGIGDLAEVIDAVNEKAVAAKYSEYEGAYDIKTDNIEAVKEQIKYEIAIEKFLKSGGYGAFTTNFQDLHGLRQLPGLAVQRLMERGFGFGGEGDWKTAALSAIIKHIYCGLEGASGFMEDYTYDLNKCSELVLGAHMLEVDPVFASTRPTVEVHPLGIGGKEAPARLVFDGIEGEGYALTIVDMGERFRMIAHKIELVKQPKAMPKLPVAKVMWKLLPDFKTGAKAWIYAGGAHHTVVSTQVCKCDIYELAKMWNIELVIIDEKTDIYDFQDMLRINDRVWK